MNSLSYKKVGALFSGVFILFFITIGATSSGEKRVSLDESILRPTETIPVEQLPTYIIEQVKQTESSTDNEFQNEEVEQDTPTPIPTVNIQKEPINTPTPYTVETQQIYSGGSYDCDCKKTCPNISSCSEAQYLLNSCGCSARDGDNDGIACDGAPLNCQ